MSRLTAKNERLKEKVKSSKTTSLHSTRAGSHTLARDEETESQDQQEDVSSFQNQDSTLTS